MIVEPCPYDAFATVVRAEFRPGRVGTYRFLHFDRRQGVMAFFDLEYRGVALDRMFVVKTLNALAALPEDAVRVVSDPCLLAGPKTPLAPRVERDWEARWRIVRSMVDAEWADADLLAGHQLSDLYTDATWRLQIVAAQRSRVGAPYGVVERCLASFLRFGATKRALLPQTHRCGAPGVARSTFPRAKKPGRRTAGQQRGQQRAELGNRFSPLHRQRLADAINAVIEQDGPHAIFALRNNRVFLDHFYADHCWEPDSRSPDGRRPMDPRKIPSERQVVYHKDRMIAQRPEISAVADEVSRLAGGYASDLTLDVLDIADLDGARFPNVRLVVADDASDHVLRKACVHAGEAVLILAVARGSECYVGWYLTAKAENGDAYRYCIYNLLMDKAERLRTLGLDPAAYPGIVSGAVDVVYVDRGPGASRKVMEWSATGIKLDPWLARAGAPQDKGSVEGGVGRIKANLEGMVLNRAASRACRYAEKVRRLVINSLQAYAASVVTLQTIATGRARRKGKIPRVIYATPKALERLIIMAMNAANLKRRSSPLCQTEAMRLAGVAPNGASIFRYRQSLRRGDAAYGRHDEDLRASLLEHRIVTVRKGRVQVGAQWYGNPPSEDIGRKGADELLVHVREQLSAHPRQKIKITVVPEPYGNYIWWERGPHTWELLAPDVASANRCPKGRDLIERLAMQDDWAYATTCEKQKQVRARVHSGLTTEAKEELQSIRTARDQYWVGEKGLVDKQARAGLQKAEIRERFDENCAGARIPELPDKPTEECGAPAQRHRARTISGESKSLAEMLRDESSSLAKRSVGVSATRGSCLTGNIDVPKK
ncbi:hypothetical protein [Cupriavidus pampae]|uniref:Transposase n=1 Tax=Cupriavidus pampae TaxID=659251 RepID=A0ABM8XSV0_9BURK|nr:hypothetical protein [Cupriavidus pampae]CAG9183391.1 hypothetical protein LMG32289_05365 [Cupriavidus pampae]